MTTETEKLLAKWRGEDADSWIPAGISNRTYELEQALARDRANDMTLIDGLCGQVNELRAAQPEYDRELIAEMLDDLCQQVPNYQRSTAMVRE